MNNGTLKYKGYEGSVEYSAEDDCLCGKVLNIRGLLSYEGQTLQELRKDFELCVDDYLALCARKGVEPECAFKGSFNVRTKPEIHRELVWLARQESVSLNTFVGRLFEKTIREHQDACL